MKNFLILFFFPVIVFSQPSIKERVEAKILKEYVFQNYKIKISNTLPFTVEKGGKELFSGCFWTGQGSKKEDGKIRHTHEGWQFSDLRGKVKGEIVSESPLKIKIDTRKEAKNQNYPVGFYEEIIFLEKVIKVKYEFEINKDTDYGVRVYISFTFNPEIVDKEIKPFLDEEKAIYETKKGSITISYSSDFKPDRFNASLWKDFRVFLSFPDGFNKGEKRTGEITITLP